MPYSGSARVSWFEPDAGSCLWWRPCVLSRGPRPGPGSVAVRRRTSAGRSQQGRSRPRERETRCTLTSPNPAAMRAAPSSRCSPKGEVTSREIVLWQGLALVIAFDKAQQHQTSWAPAPSSAPQTPGRSSPWAGGGRSASQKPRQTHLRRRGATPGPPVPGATGDRTGQPESIERLTSTASTGLPSWPRYRPGPQPRSATRPSPTSSRKRRPSSSLASPRDACQARGDAVVDRGGRGVHQGELCPPLRCSVLRSVP